jgi:hypothetical protein
VEGDSSIDTTGEKAGLTLRPKIQQVLESSTAATVVSLSGLGEGRPPLKKVNTKGYLPPFARFAHVG